MSVRDGAHELLLAKTTIAAAIFQLLKNMSSRYDRSRQTITN